MGRSQIAETCEVGMPCHLDSSSSFPVAKIVGQNSGSGTLGSEFVGISVGRRECLFHTVARNPVHPCTWKGRVVLRGAVAKNDSGSCAVFTEQGSSASQMTAANVPDVIDKLQGCAGQASDAVSASTKSRWRTLREC